MKPFNIITTAELRPDLIKRTFSSFQENLFKDDIKNAHLIMSIHNFHYNKRESQNHFWEVLDILDRFEFKSISIQNPPLSSFIQSLNWCLRYTEHPLVFNLLPNWELKRTIDFQAMVQEFEDQKLVHLRLSDNDSEEKVLQQKPGLFLPYNDKYFIVTNNIKRNLGWNLLPSLNRSSFLQEFKNCIYSGIADDNTIKRGSWFPIEFKYGVWQEPSFPASIVDIRNDK